jgi:hypothetical protein
MVRNEITRRITGYIDQKSGLTLTVILALAQCLVWLAFFFIWVQRGTPGVVLIPICILIGVIVVGAIFFHIRKIDDLQLVFISLINIFFLIIIDFGYLYWGFGTRANFNITLSHFDAIYFALGTLTTVGAGSIEATSETARVIQSAQMFIDVALVLFAAGLIIGRASSMSSKRR